MSNENNYPELVKFSEILQELHHNSRLRVIFVLGSVVHLVLGQLYFGYFDWLAMWTSAEYIANGGGLYDNVLPSFEFNGRIHEARPLHMPLFIYFLSIFAWINAPRLARIVLWIFLIWGSLLLLRMVYRESTSKYALIIYFFNPITLHLSYQGLFDIVPAVMVLWSVILFIQTNNLHAGMIIGIGTVTKLYPIYVGYTMGLILVANLVQELRTSKPTKIYYFQEIKEILRFGFGVVIIVAPVIMLFSIKYPSTFLNQAIFAQVDRTQSTFSIWAVVLRKSSVASWFYIIQRTFLIFTPVFIIFGINRITKGSRTTQYGKSYTFNLIITVSLILLLLSSNVFYINYYQWIIPGLAIASFYHTTTSHRNKKFLVLSMLPLIMSYLEVILYYGLIPLLHINRESYYIGITIRFWLYTFYLLILISYLFVLHTSQG